MRADQYLIAVGCLQCFVALPIPFGKQQPYRAKQRWQPHLDQEHKIVYVTGALPSVSGAKTEADYRRIIKEDRQAALFAIKEKFIL